jgi:hypothetical protein
LKLEAKAEYQAIDISKVSLQPPITKQAAGGRVNSPLPIARRKTIGPPNLNLPPLITKLETINPPNLVMAQC